MSEKLALELEIKAYADMAAAERAKIVADQFSQSTTKGGQAAAEAVAPSKLLDVAHGDLATKASAAALAHGHLNSAVHDVTNSIPGLAGVIHIAKNPFVELFAVLGEGLAVLRQHEAVFLQLSKHGADASNIQEYTESVKNLKKFLGVGMEEASQMFTRAMHGHYRQLQLNGIEIDKSLNQHEQLESIMKQLADGGGRLAEARAKTLTGEFQNLKFQAHELFSQIGQLEKDTGILQGTMQILSNVIKALTFFLPATNTEIEGLAKKMKPLKDGAIDAAGGLDELGGEFGTAGGKAEAAAKKFEDATKELERFRKAKDELAGAKEANLLAGVDLQEAQAKQTKTLTPQMAAGFAKQRSEIRLAGEREKLANEASAFNERRRLEEEEQSKAEDARTKSATNEAKAQEKLKELFPKDFAKAAAVRHDYKSDIEATERGIFLQRAQMPLDDDDKRPQTEAVRKQVAQRLTELEEQLKRLKEEKEAVDAIAKTHSAAVLADAEYKKEQPARTKTAAITAAEAETLRLKAKTLESKAIIEQFKSADEAINAALEKRIEDLKLIIEKLKAGKHNADALEAQLKELEALKKPDATSHGAPSPPAVRPVVPPPAKTTSLPTPEEQRAAEAARQHPAPVPHVPTAQEREDKYIESLNRGTKKVSDTGEKLNKSVSELAEAVIDNHEVVAGKIDDLAEKLRNLSQRMDNSLA